MKKLNICILPASTVKSEIYSHINKPQRDNDVELVWEQITHLVSNLQLFFVTLPMWENSLMIWGEQNTVEIILANDSSSSYYFSMWWPSLL